MSDEGIRLVSRLALIVVVILVGAAVRTAVGPGRQRARVMAAGTVGGMALGVLASTTLSKWIGADVSSVSALAGVIVGWAIAWGFARRLPRYAN